MEIGSSEIFIKRSSSFRIFSVRSKDGSSIRFFLKSVYE
ncbi:hypothetical protein LEP1GSC120_1214 [Leptospira santarosai str. 200702252]|nr:hypothetical protein LEP1GSC130_0290 [Leptospira santarosai str. 200403458]EMP00256.1 hypothetical protein LEP1GSC120_1214 [Leptospira santarosai str. 200702252]